MPSPPGPSRARKSDASPRAWQRMLSGRKLDLLDPSPFDIEIDDIAHGLARVARWNGQTIGEHPFSVAQHSLVVIDIMDALSPKQPVTAKLFALLHDAPEYVIGDMISPFKSALGLDYRAFEDRLASAIHMRFSLPPQMPGPLKALVKKADVMSAWLEAVQLAGFDIAEANKFFRKPPDAALFTLKPMSAAEAQTAFLVTFRALVDQE